MYTYSSIQTGLCTFLGYHCQLNFTRRQQNIFLQNINAVCHPQYLLNSFSCEQLLHLICSLHCGRTFSINSMLKKFFVGMPNNQFCTFSSNCTRLPSTTVRNGVLEEQCPVASGNQIISLDAVKQTLRLRHCKMLWRIV